MVNFLGGGGWNGMRPGGPPVADPIRKIFNPPGTEGPQRPVGGPVQRTPGFNPGQQPDPTDPIRRRFAQPLRGRTVPMSSLLNPGQGRMELA